MKPPTSRTELEAARKWVADHTDQRSGAFDVTIPAAALYQLLDAVGATLPAGPSPAEIGAQDKIVAGIGEELAVARNAVTAIERRLQHQRTILADMHEQRRVHARKS